MRRIVFLALTLVVSLGLFTPGLLYAHDPSYNDEDVKVEAKKIDKGINVTITSDEPETVEYIQTHIPWYERIFRKFSHFSHMMQGRGGMHGMGSSNCPMM